MAKVDKNIISHTYKQDINLGRLLEDISMSTPQMTRMYQYTHSYIIHFVHELKLTLFN